MLKNDLTSSLSLLTSSKPYKWAVFKIDVKDEALAASLGMK